MLSLDERRRRARYRAEHRGTSEMDWLLGRYALATVAKMSEQDLGTFEVLLALPDPDLQRLIMTGEGLEGNDLAGIVAQIRAFHGLK
jgi:antitoxin CptB